MSCVLLGDIIDSRMIEDREPLQKSFKDVLNRINREYKTSIMIPFEIRDGDSFRGILSEYSNLMEIVSVIKIAMIPYEIRIGIGVGELSVSQNSDYTSDELDGSAFHQAKNALDYLDRKKNSYENLHQTTMINIEGLNNMDSLDKDYMECKLELINALLCSCSNIEMDWKSIYQVPILYKREGQSQRQISKALGKPQSTIQRRLASSKIHLYEYYMDTVQKGIDKLWER